MSKVFQSALICVAVAVATPALAKPSINDVQGCQAVVDFTIERIGDVEKYNKTAVKSAQTTLRAYNDFLQSEHITPGLQAYAGGDTAQVKSLQTQIDAYKTNLVEAFKARHPQPRIFMDQLVAIDGCYTKAPMDAAGTEKMKAALMAVMAMAQQE